MAAPKKKAKVKPLFSNRDWEEFYLSWLASLQSEESRMVYAGHIKRFFGQLRKPPDQATSVDVQTFCDHPTNRKGVLVPPSPDSYNVRLSVISSFYSAAMQHEVITKSGRRHPLMRNINPAKNIKKRKERTPPRDLTEKELRDFFAVIPRNTLQGKRDLALFLSYFWTARRRTEVVNLLWGDLEQVWYMRNGISQPGWRYKWKGKGHDEKDDWAELPAPAMAAIQAYLEADGRWGKMQPSDPLFPAMKNSRAGAQMRPSNVNYLFNKYARLAGLHKGAVVHSLRWEAAYRRWQRNGHNLMEVSKLLRHSSLDITLQYLSRRDEESQPDLTADLLASEFANL